jgi:hypothetical protein
MSPFNDPQLNDGFTMWLLGRLAFVAVCILVFWLGVSIIT